MLSSSLRPRAARAIHASVLQAGSAAPGQLSPERLPGPVDPDAGITGCNANLLGVPSHAHPVEIDPADGRAILRLEGLHQVQDAGADHRLELAIGRGRRLGFSRNSINGPAAGTLPAIVIREGIPKHPEKPHRN